MMRFQSEAKCKLCTKIEEREKSIRKEQERLRHLLRAVRGGGKHVPSTEDDCARQEARIQMELIVLRAMQLNMGGGDQSLESSSASSLLSSDDEPRYAKSK
jgi:hypothetical protein